MTLLTWPRTRRRTVRRLGDAAGLVAVALVMVMIGAPEAVTPPAPAWRGEAVGPASTAPTHAPPRLPNLASGTSVSATTPSARYTFGSAIPDRARAPTTTTTTTTTTTPPTTTTTLPPGAVKLPASGPPPVIYNIATADRVVFVTIDDGWTNDSSVLTFIHDHNWPVSAFLIDQVASATAPFWQRLVSMGGVVEDHSVNHPALRGRSLAAQQAEICPPVDDYQRLFGRRPTLFRPPYGSMDDTTVAAAGACGLRAVVLWNAVIDRGKFTHATPGPLGPGDIVLMHWGPALAGDLQQLSALMAAGGLHAALLEDYLRAP